MNSASAVFQAETPNQATSEPESTHAVSGATHHSAIQVNRDNVNQDSIAPLLAFPPELLGKIFLLYRGSYIPNSPSRTGDRNHWIYVTHVCQAWRTIALDLPALWSHIDCSDKPSLAEAMLQRSKEAPLNIKYHSQFSGKEGLSFLLKVLRDAGRRLKSVEVCCEHDRTDAIEIFPTHTPRLEEFKGRFFSGVMETFLLHGTLPSLKVLEIDGIIRWKVLPAAPRLTVLKIKNTKIGSAMPRPQAKDFLRSLSSMPELKHLNLSQFLPSGPLDNSSATPPLESLVLEDEDDIITNFLSSCTVLVASRISIISNDHHFNQAEPVAALDRCLSTLSTRWRHRTSGACRMAEGVQHLALHGWGEGNAHFQFSFRDETVYDLQVRFPHHYGVTAFLDSDPLDAFLAVTRHLDLSSLQTLILGNCEDLRRSVWLTIFSPLQKLKKIHFGASRIRGFWTSALSEYEETASPLFPALKSIAYSSPDVYDDSRTIIALIFVLSRRPNAHKIEELRLTNCIVGKICAERIQKNWKTLGIVEEGTRIIDP